MAVDNPAPLGQTAANLSNGVLGSVLGGAETIAQIGALFGLVNNGNADALLAAEAFKNYAAGRADKVDTVGRLFNALTDFKVNEIMQERGHSAFVSKLTAAVLSNFVEKVVVFLSTAITGGVSKDAPISEAVKAAQKQFGGGRPITADASQAPTSGLNPMGQPATARSVS